jgi:hypothetical protein
MQLPQIWSKWVGWLFILHKSQHETKLFSTSPTSRNSDNSASSLRFLASHHAYIHGYSGCLFVASELWTELMRSFIRIHWSLPQSPHLTLWHFKVVGSQLCCCCKVIMDFFWGAHMQTNFGWLLLGLVGYKTVKFYGIKLWKELIFLF